MCSEWEITNKSGVIVRLFWHFYLYSLTFILTSCTSPTESSQQKENRKQNIPLQKQIEEAREEAKQKRWFNAIELFQKIIDQSGDELVFFDPSHPNQKISCRLLCQIYLSHLSEEAVQIYRNRVDRTVHRQLEEGRKNHNEELLESILDNYFLSSDTPQVIELLAEWAFERGDLESATYYYSLIAPENFSADPVEKMDKTEHEIKRDGLPKKPSLRREYRLSKSQNGQYIANQLICKLFHGYYFDREELNSRLREFQKQFPNLEGFLAGKQGKLNQLLQEQIDLSPYGVGKILKRNPWLSNSFVVSSEKMIQDQIFYRKQNWVTYGVTNQRQGRIQEPILTYWPNQPDWQIKLPTRTTRELPFVPPFKKIAIPPSPLLLTGYTKESFSCPIIWHNKVLLADGTRLFAFDADRGAPAKIFVHKEKLESMLDFRSILNLKVETPEQNTAPEYRFTITVGSDDCLYIRIGYSAFQNPQRNNEPLNNANDRYSLLICLKSDDRQHAAEEVSIKWVLAPPTIDNDSLQLWEGSPLVEADHLYACFSQFQGNEMSLEIVCYEGILSEKPPHILWRYSLGKQSLSSRNTRFAGTLLSKWHRAIYYLSPSGTVIALHQRNGKPIWEYKYLSSSNKESESKESSTISPAIIKDGKVMFSPPESKQLVCLSCDTGQVLWESPELPILQLIGVSDRQVIATIDRPYRGIAAFDLLTGSVSQGSGWIIHDNDGVQSSGNGFIAGNMILWPTIDALYFLDVQDGSQCRQPLVFRDNKNQVKSWGNLCYQNGYFIVATGNELWGFVSKKKQLSKLNEHLKSRPRDRGLLFEKALALVESSQKQQAIQELKKVINSSSSEIDPLTQKANHHLFRLQWQMLLESFYNPSIKDIPFREIESGNLALNNKPRNNNGPQETKLSDDAQKSPQGKKVLQTDIPSAYQRIVSQLRQVLASKKTIAPTNQNSSSSPIYLLNYPAALISSPIIFEDQEADPPVIAFPKEQKLTPTAFQTWYEEIERKLPNSGTVSLLAQLLQEDKLIEQLFATPEQIAKAARLFLRLQQINYKKTNTEDPEAKWATKLLRNPLSNKADQANLPFYHADYTRSPRSTKEQSFYLLGLGRLAEQYEKLQYRSAALHLWREIQQLGQQSPELHSISHNRFWFNQANFMISQSTNKSNQTINRSPKELDFPLAFRWEELPNSELKGIYTYADSTIFLFQDCVIRQTAGFIDWVWHVDDLRFWDRSMLIRSLRIDRPIPHYELDAFQLYENEISFLINNKLCIILNLDTTACQGFFLQNKSFLKDNMTSTSFKLPNFFESPLIQYQRKENNLLFQDQYGTIRILDLTNKRFTKSTSKYPFWHQSPFFLKKSAYLLPENYFTITARSEKDHSQIWRWELPRTDSLVGDLPTIISNSDTILIHCRRNYGDEVFALSAQTGKPKWQESLLFPGSKFDLSQTTFSENALQIKYWVYYFNGKIIARDLELGQILWEIDQDSKESEFQLWANSQIVVFATPRSLSRISEDQPRQTKRSITFAYLSYLAPPLRWLPSPVEMNRRSAESSSLENYSAPWELSIFDVKSGELLQKITQTLFQSPFDSPFPVSEQAPSLSQIWRNGLNPSKASDKNQDTTIVPSNGLFVKNRGKIIRIQTQLFALTPP